MYLDEVYTRVLLSAYHGLARPVLFRQGGGDPEVAHEFTIKVLTGLPDWVLRLAGVFLDHKKNPVEVAGIKFPGRVGVAAGVDKDGTAVKAWSHLGMGFAELGTVTPRPQPGNPKPRQFRLKASEATINRMGFNNKGASELANLLKECGLGTSGHGKLEPKINIPIGVSIGKNKVTPEEKAVSDYVQCVAALRDTADYLAINVSSPNTPGLRKLQSQKALSQIATAVVDAAEGTPVFVKIAPDMANDDFDKVISVCEESGVSAIIATNTTIGREGIAQPDLKYADQAGGMAGRPLTARSLEVVEYLANRTSLPIVGVGGLMSPRDAQNMFDAGAVLLQIYTGFIYHGPALAHGINRLTTPKVGS